MTPPLILMAAPMVAISMSDTARRWLPKPGAWMETLKQVMAFPLYLTAVWLLWVAGKQSGVDTWQRRRQVS